MLSDAQVIDIGTLIARSVEIKGGRPLLAGTGVTVQRIVGWYKLGLTPEEIAQEVGHLSVGQVHAALAYYHTNTSEIERYIAEEDTDYQRLREEYANPPALS